MNHRRRRAFVYGTTLGIGGLGVQAGNALRALARGAVEVHAIGPGHAAAWAPPHNVVWHVVPRRRTPLSCRPFRRYAGLGQQVHDRHVGSFARDRLDRVRPDLCYAFTQVALESLEWAKSHDVPAVLESPNGHIRAFRDVYVGETRRWCGGRYWGHPSRRTVRRVEQEYALAPHVRVSSLWARRSLVSGGVSDRVVSVFQQPVDLERYAPSSGRLQASGPLRVCFVGSLDLRKGFPYLLGATRQLGRPVALELVGGTGDRCCSRLLDRERHGLSVTVAPGDPRDALARAELFVFPTLEDGSPFAVAEAMSSGLPIVTTTSTGAAEWVCPGRSGWVVEPASEQAIVAALEQAHASRNELRHMGQMARADTERRVQSCEEAVATWVQTL